jgi:hypothetical protein
LRIGNSSFAFYDLSPVMDFTKSAGFLLGPLSAITLHELVLRRVEVDHLAIPIAVTSSVAYWTFVHYSGFVFATAIAASFWIPLWLYMGAYRAFFHPLRNYAGPFGARLSRWWTVKQNWDTDLHFHRVQQQLQKKYGDYVRTGRWNENHSSDVDKLILTRLGPRELTIFDVDAIPFVLGVQAKTSKGPLFDIMEKSMHLSRDKQFHRQRRRIWDNAVKTSKCDLCSDRAPY